MKKIITFAVYILVPLIVGGISGLLTSNAMEHYNTLKQPPLSPPGMIFPIVWTILYILMGIGAFIIYTSKNDSTAGSVGLLLYYIQLFMNFVWSLIFFRGKQYLGALIWLLIMWVVVLLMLANYRKVSKLAFCLNIPLALWLTFAAYLNTGVLFLTL